jgi:hypothetical protein
VDAEIVMPLVFFLCGFAGGVTVMYLLLAHQARKIELEKARRRGWVR